MWWWAITTPFESANETLPVMLSELYSQGKPVRAMKYWYDREDRGENNPERLYVLDDRKLSYVKILVDDSNSF